MITLLLIGSNDKDITRKVILYIEIITRVSLGIGSIMYWEYKLYYASLW